MQISVRAPLAAGTAALMGAAVLAVTPVGPVDPLPDLRPAAIEVTLAGFDDPLLHVAGTLNLLNKFLFDSSGPVDVSPGAGTGLSAWGLFPQIAKDRVPVLNQLGVNGVDYLVTTAKGVLSVGSQLGSIVWHLPATVAAAAEQAASGHLGSAGAVLEHGIADPLAAAGVTAVRTVAYAPAAMLTHAYFLVKTMPEIVGYFIKPLGAQAQAVADVTLKTAIGIAIGLSTNNPSFAWNNAVAGLLGPYGIPGVLLSLTVGAGLPTSGPVEIPSIRTEIATAIGRIHFIVTSLSPVPPPAAVAPAASRQRQASAARPASHGNAKAGSARTAASTHKTHTASRTAHERPSHGRAGSARAHGH